MCYNGTQVDGVLCSHSFPPLVMWGDEYEVVGTSTKNASLKKSRCVNLHKLDAVTSWEQFWPVLAIRVAQTSSYGSLHIFRDGVTPSYEDPKNSNGGLFKVTCDTVSGSHEALHKLSTAFILDHMPYSSSVNGLTLAKKQKTCMVKMWVQNSRNKATVDAIRGFINEALQGHLKHCQFCPTKYLLQTISQRSDGALPPSSKPNRAPALDCEAVTPVTVADSDPALLHRCGTGCDQGAASQWAGSATALDPWAAPAAPPDEPMGFFVTHTSGHRSSSDFSSSSTESVECPVGILGSGRAPSTGCVMSRTASMSDVGKCVLDHAVVQPSQRGSFVASDDAGSDDWTWPAPGSEEDFECGPQQVPLEQVPLEIVTPEHVAVDQVALEHVALDQEDYKCLMTECRYAATWAKKTRLPIIARLRATAGRSCADPAARSMYSAYLSAGKPSPCDEVCDSQAAGPWAHFG
eukprot:CAMPEP_0174378464 /NCGR_PEP_ID=MMETSP0811_2-20130205/122066_1 /TAXON_ID=73025 ORGANISM="Eutreptiella gymnastica-like, Strain CCMP1594" /NCGR_SAMPLE_ID=MMETSP0811_2 /ASSEMBLY_ACC=CAM_ASM_000667 /LENGTH=462 /DNA_ID=CAMNT_0015530687 /DNA_START=38 /DNA_END=1426 /DNA_ORIENTATION=+